MNDVIVVSNEKEPTIASKALAKTFPHVHYDGQITRYLLDHTKPAKIIIYANETNNVDLLELDKYQKIGFDTNVVELNTFINEHWREDQILVYVSSEYVFDGRRAIKGGYAEFHDPLPKSYYGLTKLAAEMVARLFVGKTLIIRTSELFDDSLLDNPIFLGIKNLEATIEFHKGTHSFMYAQHFADAFHYMVSDMLVNEDKYTEHGIINIAGSLCVDNYTFWSVVSEYAGLESKLIRDKWNKETRYLGLRVDLADRLGIKPETYVQGVKDFFTHE